MAQSDDAPALPTPPSPPDHRPDYVVAIGASAGGLEAIEQMFRAMPKHTGMAFVVLQHLSPDFKSQMFELMADHVRHNELSLVREERDFAWFFEQPGVECVIHEREGRIDGFIVAPRPP